MMPTGRIWKKERTDDEFMAMYEQYEALMIWKRHI